MSIYQMENFLNVHTDLRPTIRDELRNIDGARVGK